jgi:HTH-type transcriptional regulator/antitoxin HipB
MTKQRSAESFGTGIRDARVARGWSQSFLGERAGVSRPTIARVEAGQDISTATLAKVAAALGLIIGFEVREE